LTASAEERARRRFLQLQGKGQTVDIVSLSREIEERDRRDAHRAASPLVPAVDAIVIDSTSVPPDQVVEQVLQLAKARLPG
jgi:cytidylate kinase